jgi:hypothetical protein
MHAFAHQVIHCTLSSMSQATQLITAKLHTCIITRHVFFESTSRVGTPSTEVRQNRPQRLDDQAVGLFSVTPTVNMYVLIESTMFAQRWQNSKPWHGAVVSEPHVACPPAMFIGTSAHGAHNSPQNSEVVHQAVQSSVSEFSAENLREDRVYSAFKRASASMPSRRPINRVVSDGDAFSWAHDAATTASKQQGC